MKLSRLLILGCIAAITFPSCTKRFECRCMLTNKTSGLDNGSRVIQMDINGLNARKKAAENCRESEAGLNTAEQAAVCVLQ